MIFGFSNITEVPLEVLGEAKSRMRDCRDRWSSNGNTYWELQKQTQEVNTVAFLPTARIFQDSEGV